MVAPRSGPSPDYALSLDGNISWEELCLELTVKPVVIWKIALDKSRAESTSGVDGSSSPVYTFTNRQPYSSWRLYKGFFGGQAKSQTQAQTL
jgi:hypothetical protein